MQRLLRLGRFSEALRLHLFVSSPSGVRKWLKTYHSMRRNPQLFQFMMLLADHLLVSPRKGSYPKVTNQSLFLAKSCDWLDQMSDDNNSKAFENINYYYITAQRLLVSLLSGARYSDNQVYSQPTMLYLYVFFRHLYVAAGWICKSVVPHHLPPSLKLKLGFHGAWPFSCFHYLRFGLSHIFL